MYHFPSSLLVGLDSPEDCLPAIGGPSRVVRPEHCPLNGGNPRSHDGGNQLMRELALMRIALGSPGVHGLVDLVDVGVNLRII